MVFSGSKPWVDRSRLRVISCVPSSNASSEEEIKELNEAKKEIYLEAKSNGLDVEIIREVVRLRKRDEKERGELDELLEVYLRAIKGASRVSKAA
jgi:uncharacterized protein (UPF0335 family)